MSSKVVKNIAGATRVFSSCGGFIKPKYLCVGYQKYKPFTEEVFCDCLTDKEFLEFCKDNKKANWFMIVDNNYTEEDLTPFNIDNQNRFIKRLKNFVIIYNCLKSTEIKEYQKLKSNTLYR